MSDDNVTSGRLVVAGRDVDAWLLTLAGRDGRPPRAVLVLDRRKATDPDRQLEQLVGTLPGIGPVCARRLLERFPTLQQLVVADVPALRTVPGIGPKRAATLFALFRHPYGGAAVDAARAPAQLALAS